MPNIMTIRTKQNPLLLFFRNKFFLIRRNNLVNFDIRFAIHSFIMMVEGICSYRQVRSFAIVTLITKFQNKFSFGYLSIFSPLCKILLSSYGCTCFAITSYSQSFSMTFREMRKFLGCFTSGASSVGLAIYNRFHHNSITKYLTVINVT